MKYIARLFLALNLVVLAAEPAASAAPVASREDSASDVSAQQLNRILGNMEYLRGFRGTAFNFTAEVISVDNGESSDPHQLDVKISKQGYALIEVLNPRNERGRRMLLRDHDLWMYLPSSSNIIRIAPLQRVFGAASIADVLNQSYLSDYVVQSSRRSADGMQLQLTLKSKDDGPTYARVDVDYDLATDRPIESRHYAASDRLLKTIQYKSFRDYDGSPKVEKIAIIDGLRKSSVVWIKMGEYGKSTYPDAMFTRAALSTK